MSTGIYEPLLENRLPHGSKESQEVAMLVTKVKAINQWMECESCKLQQVKSITPRKSEDRVCVHCRGTYLKEIRIYSN